MGDVLTKDYRHFIPAPPSVITLEAWETRNALAAKHYPNAADILAFDEDHLINILMEVEDEEKPDEHFPVGPKGSPRPLAWLQRRSWLEWHLFRGIAPAARRPSISPRLRGEVIARDGYNCGICGLDVPPDDVHLDHIKPFSRGGPTNLTNLRVTHSRCNIAKGARY